EAGAGDALPLLAFTLEQLYLDHHQTGQLRLADYEKFGGINGAINAAATRAFARADADPRIPSDRKTRETLLRRAFVPWLAGIDPDSRTPCRNLASRSEIPRESVPLIDLLVEERLLSADTRPNRDPATCGEPFQSIIEPIHEALLRQWDLLDGWLKEDFDLLRSLDGLRRAAHDWNANARDKSWLAHQGQRLSEAEALNARADIAAKLDAADRCYLVECRAREDAVRSETERQRAVTERNQALVAAEKLRNDFVNHVSYELRTPLTNIIGFTQLLAAGGVGALNPKQLEYAGFITDSSHALLAIIDDILDLASIDAGALELRLEDVDVAEAMKAAAAGVQDRLSEAAIELRIVMTDGVGSLRADGRRVRQVLFNLLSNAINYSEAGQTVTLAAMRRGSEIVFKVSDRGRGIPPEMIDRVFDRFETFANGSRHRGPGLGLSIVRAMAELHHGRVLIDTAPNEGTTVTCIFPVDLSAALAASPQLAAPSRPQSAQ